MNWPTTRNLARNLTLSREPFTMFESNDTSGTGESVEHYRWSRYAK